MKISLDDIKNKTGNGFHMRLKQFLLNEHYKGNEVIIEDSKGEYKQFIKLLTFLQFSMPHIYSPNLKNFSLHILNSPHEVHNIFPKFSLHTVHCIEEPYSYHPLST